MAQIISITSEALQSTIRRLLPSQQGFGEDLQASNVVTPIIDLTPSAEGSELPRDLARAIAFGSQTSNSVENATTTLVSTTGFYRVFGNSALDQTVAARVDNELRISDGLSTKTIWTSNILAFNTSANLHNYFDFVVFLAAGDSLVGHSDGNGARLFVTTRQIADVNGNITNPDGYSPQ